MDTDLRQRFSDRILSVDTDVAEHWGELSAQAEKAGRVAPAIDGLIVATAAAHGLRGVEFSVVPVRLIYFSPQRA